MFGLALARSFFHPSSPIAEIDRALKAGEFKPYYQPIFDLEARGIIGCEILARWVHADGPVTPPSRFIPLAESSGRIEPLTWQLLTSALDDLRPLFKQDKSFKMSFNVAPRHLTAVGFLEKLRQIVASASISPRQVVIEITEREEPEDLARAAAVVTHLRDHEFKVALDDVGTGHSGLSQIQKLGANIVKIDKFFTDAITGDRTAVAVIDMLVRLAHQLNMTVVAEGIENEAQIAALLECGVDEGQGSFCPSRCRSPSSLC